MATDTQPTTKDRPHRKRDAKRGRPEAEPIVDADANQPPTAGEAASRDSQSAGVTRQPPRVRRGDATRRIRAAAEVSDTLPARDRLTRLADQVKAGAADPQRVRFIESAIAECLEEAVGGTVADRWLAAEGAAWALAWVARTRRAGGSAGRLLERLVREALSAQDSLSQGDTSSARFVLALARLFADIEACRRLEAGAADALVAEIERLVSPRGVVNVADGGEMVRRVVRWTTCRELADATGAAIWSAETDRRWRESATAAIRLLGRQGRRVEAAGLMPVCFTAPLLEAVAALDGRRARTVKAVRKPRRAKEKPSRCIQLHLNDAASAVATMRTGWGADAVRVLVDYREAIPRLEIAAGDRMLVEGAWDWSVAVGDERLEPEAAWSVACWETGRKACYLELTTPLPGGRQFERSVVLLPKDRVLLLADAVTVVDDHAAAAAVDDDPDTGRIRYASCLPLAAGLEAEPADETREIVVRDTAVRFMALPLALQEWRVPTRGGFAAEPGRLNLAQESPGRRLYAPLWLDLDPARADHPLTWRQLTVADTRQNLGPHQAAGFRIQVGIEQWLVYRSLDGARNRTLLGCNVACDFLLGQVKPNGVVARTLEIQ